MADEEGELQWHHFNDLEDARSKKHGDLVVYDGLGLPLSALIEWVVFAQEVVTHIVFEQSGCNFRLELSQ